MKGVHSDERQKGLAASDKVGNNLRVQGKRLLSLQQGKCNGSGAMLFIIAYEP